MLVVMNTSTLLLGLVGVAAGVAGAATTVVLLDNGTAPTTTLAGVQPTVEANELRDLRARLKWLEQQNDGFAQRIQELEIVASDFEPADLSPKELVAASAKPATGPRAGLSEPIAQDLIVESVGEALETIRAREEAARDEERADRRAERIEERLAELAEQLALDSYQTEQMRTWMSATDTARDALRDEVRDAGDWGAMREKFDELRDKGRSELETFLTSYQLEQYDALGNEGGGGGGRGRGGRGGRGGGGF